MKKEDKPPAEEIHEMLSEHNAKSSKTFYYTEEEAKQLCKLMTSMSDADFEIWWNNVKKQ
jgi:uncharacterized protein YabN with tetrapyrrole methylase and pyrophosphatase domain